MSRPYLKMLIPAGAADVDTGQQKAGHEKFLGHPSSESPMGTALRPGSLTAKRETLQVINRTFRPRARSRTTVAATARRQNCPRSRPPLQKHCSVKIFLEALPNTS